MQQSAAGTDTGAGDLLLAVAEQLKVPLTIIARQAELAQASIADGDGTATGDGLLFGGAYNPALICTQADAALQLVDCYLLGLQLWREQAQLELEPVSVSSTLVDTAHALEQYAKQYDVDIAVTVGGKYEPVMAHPQGLRAALLSLGYGLVESPLNPVGGRARRRQLTLATHRTAHGIIAGIYGDYDALCGAQWRAALQLYGRALQPLAAITAGSGAGLFVADTIFRSMSARLQVGSWQRGRGLAAALNSSRQLQFV